MAIKFEDHKSGGSSEKAAKAKGPVGNSLATPENAPSPADDQPIGELPFGKPAKAEKKSGRKAAKT